MRRLFAWLARLFTTWTAKAVVARDNPRTRAPTGAQVTPRRISLWVKIAYTLFVVVLTPVYWVHYGPSNFLWFSDIALYGALLALWLESPLIAGMMALAILIPELGWNIGFIGMMLYGQDIIGLSSYMFDENIPRYLRALSLFHVFLPILLVSVLFTIGYDRRALLAQTLLAWIAVPLSYPFAHAPEHNINWTRGFGEEQHVMHDWLWVGMLMVGFPLLVYLPTHLLLRRLFA